MAVEFAKRQLLRVEELDSAKLPEKFVEVIEGEAVVMTPAGRRHNIVALNLVWLFRGFCEHHPELAYGADNEGFLIRRNPDTLLSPDACLFRRRPELEKTWLEFAPDIAVEVLSPSNSPAELVYKRNAYFAAGTEQFWVVDPEKQQLTLHFADGRTVTASGDASIPCEGIVSGLHISLAEVFRG